MTAVLESLADFNAPAAPELIRGLVLETLPQSGQTVAGVAAPFGAASGGAVSVCAASGGHAGSRPSPSRPSPGSAPVFMVAVGATIVKASLAPSCLLAPQDCDEVLCLLGGGPAVVVAVLARPDPGRQAELALPARTAVKAPEIDFEAGALTAKAESARVETAGLALSGSRLELGFKYLGLAAGLVSAAFRSLLGRGRGLRLEVERSAVIEARDIDLKAQDDLSARGGGLDLRAKGSVVIDGRDLRLG